MKSLLRGDNIGDILSERWRQAARVAKKEE